MWATLWFLDSPPSSSSLLFLLGRQISLLQVVRPERCQVFQNIFCSRHTLVSFLLCFRSGPQPWGLWIHREETVYAPGREPSGWQANLGLQLPTELGHRSKGIAPHVCSCLYTHSPWGPPINLYLPSYCPPTPSTTVTILSFSSWHCFINGTHSFSCKSILDCLILWVVSYQNPSQESLTPGGQAMTGHGDLLQEAGLCTHRGQTCRWFTKQGLSCLARRGPRHWPAVLTTGWVSESLRRCIFKDTNVQAPSLEILPQEVRGGQESAL